MFKDLPDILTISQVAEALSICEKAAYALVHTNQLGFKRIGKKYVIPKFCLEEYLKSARNNVKL